MKPLEKQSAHCFLLLADGILEPGDHRRFGDGKNGFMPLSVECVDCCPQGRIISLAHYGELNGDLMCDPEMTFLLRSDGQVLPLTYRNDYVGVDQVAARLDEASNWQTNIGLQHQLVSFAQEWLRNVAEQQDLPS